MLSTQTRSIQLSKVSRPSIAPPECLSVPTLSLLLLVPTGLPILLRNTLIVYRRIRISQVSHSNLDGYRAWSELPTLILARPSISLPAGRALRLIPQLSHLQFIRWRQSDAFL